MFLEKLNESENIRIIVYISTQFALISNVFYLIIIVVSNKKFYEECGNYFCCGKYRRKSLTGISLSPRRVTMKK